MEIADVYKIGLNFDIGKFHDYLGHDATKSECNLQRHDEMTSDTCLRATDNISLGNLIRIPERKAPEEKKRKENHGTTT